MLIKLSTEDTHINLAQSSYNVEKVNEREKKERKQKETSFFLKLHFPVILFSSFLSISLEASKFYSCLINRLRHLDHWTKHTYQARLGNAICKVSHACAARSLTTPWRSGNVITRASVSLLRDGEIARVYAPSHCLLYRIGIDESRWRI